MVEESVCLVTRIGWGFKYAPAEYYVCLNDPKTEGLKVVISAFPPMAIYEHVRGLEGRIDKVILLFDFPKMSRVRTKDIYENPSEFLKDFERAIKEGAHAGSINVPEDIEIPPERVLYRIYGGPEDKDITVRYYKKSTVELAGEVHQRNRKGWSTLHSDKSSNRSREHRIVEHKDQLGELI